jgi:hypothetical protein
MGITEMIKNAKIKADEKKTEKIRIVAEQKAEQERAEQEAKEANRVKVEAKRKKLKLPHGKIHFMTYKDKTDEYSHRDIEIVKIDYKNGTLYFHAFCHLKAAIRTFKADNIIFLECEGQKIKKPWDYINRYEVLPEIKDWSADNLAES